MSVKIIQISDCHLPADPATPYRGENADANLSAVWQKAMAWGPDLVLLTGDLSEDASEASYERLGALLQADLPFLAIPGNHDEPELIRRLFPDGPWEGPFIREAGTWGIILADSTVRGRVSGRFTAEGLEELRAAMAGNEMDHLLVALHHQPVPVDAPWIDRYPLEDAGAFLHVIDAEPRVRCVIWGHIHHHFAVDRGGVLMLGAPSTAANSLPRSARFELDPAGPACRSLVLSSEGTVAYGQLYANGG